MANSVGSPEVLLKRVLALREQTPFLVALDTSAQGHGVLLSEILGAIGAFLPTSDVVSGPRGQRESVVPITYISYETSKRHAPSYVGERFHPFYSMSKPNQEKVLDELAVSQARNLIIVDSFNHLTKGELLRLLRLLSNPNNIIYGAYHLDVKGKTEQTPSVLHHVITLASVVLGIKPRGVDDSVYELQVEERGFPTVSSTSQLRLDFTYRRKSGREVQYTFNVDTSTHTYDLVLPTTTEQPEEDDSLLKDLTTFNLTTNTKQRAQRAQVELPFMEAQQSLGAVGSAIVYTFEKDDDYDEDDPYEDPF